MCLGSKAAMPKVQAAAPAPTREGVTASTDPISLAEQSRQLLQKRMGVFGNIKTTPLGDASYGNFAKFG